MTEDEARAWFADRFDHEAYERTRRFLDLVAAENEQQNLISPATIPSIWSRHAVDSAQLLKLAPPDWSSWIDIGTGGGFPGLIVGLLNPERKIALVEPRRKRAEFLQACCDKLKLANTSVHQCKVEALTAQADIISARAVASIENLLRAARQCAKVGTTWLLPRGSGSTGVDALAKLKRTMFHVEHSLTDVASTIVVLKGDGT